MSYEIKNPNSEAPAELIDQELYDAMEKAGSLRFYDVTKVTKTAKPAELSETPKPKTAKAE